MAPPVPCARMWPSRHTYIKCNVHPRVDISGNNKISTLELHSPSENSPSYHRYDECWAKIRPGSKAGSVQAVPHSSLSPALRRRHVGRRHHPRPRQPRRLLPAGGRGQELHQGHQPGYHLPHLCLRQVKLQHAERLPLALQQQQRQARRNKNIFMSIKKYLKYLNG